MTDKELADNNAFADAWCGEQATFADVVVGGSA
jgi:hypothetical protein